MSVLYLTEQRSSVGIDAETLLIKIPEDRNSGVEKRKVRVPLGKVSQVVVYGNVTMTTPAISALLAQKTEVCFLTRYGKFIGRISGEDHRHGQLRLIQGRAHDDPNARLHIATVCVRAKLHNQKTTLLRGNRMRDDPQITAAAAQIDAMITQVDALASEDIRPPDPTRPQEGTVYGVLMGLEGRAAASYFQGYRFMFDEAWSNRFTGRHKRPPTDPINALLSYGYTLLTSQTVAAAQIVGFDPYVGYLHSTQYGKPALALDIVEMFRAPIVDSVVLTLLNNRMLSANDFEERLGAWRMSDAGRKIFLTKFEERLSTEITHPVFKTKVTYRRCLELQMRLLSRWLTGELKRFREFTIR